MKDNQYKSIVWGVLLIVLGVLFLLANLDIIDFQLRNIWHLWPAALIYWGISALPVNNYLKLVLVMMLTGVLIYLLIEYPVPFEFNFDNHTA